MSLGIPESRIRVVAPNIGGGFGLKMHGHPEETLVCVLAVVTLQPLAAYSGQQQDVVVLVALLVCLIPTTIGGLLSAIGIAGMDRLVQRNVLAMSGRAVEAAPPSPVQVDEPARLV